MDYVWHRLAWFMVVQLLNLLYIFNEICVIKLEKSQIEAFFSSGLWSFGPHCVYVYTVCIRTQTHPFMHPYTPYIAI